MIKIGMEIAGRYEILEKIGTGGMSDVYRAKDHKLSRYVAVKVLKQEFSENTEFVRKFRTEAQAAAGLMHPNIVNVYDVGEEGGSYFIVMELVEGITLKKYIEKKARLSVKEAVSIAIQVAMGIEAAHNNHIIHRDIKPQNIIISREGKVKVTDFGIAKAATSNTITSNVMGSVHYTSPEQVRGGFSDEKSDIYSLGITMFEMLTGRVPYNGETTVAVAIKHIQEEMPSPREYVAEIPISVEQIVLKCTQKSPDRRYQNAPELIEDLKRSLISPDEDFVKMDVQEALGETKDITDREIRKIKKEVQKRDEFDARMGNTGTVEELQPGRRPAGRGDMPVSDRAGEEEEGYGGETRVVSSDLMPPRKKNAEESSGKKGNSAKNGKKKKNANREEELVRERRGREEAGMGRGSDEERRRPANRNSVNKKKRNHNGNSSSARRGNNNRRGRYEEEDPKMEFLTTVLIMVAAIAVGLIFLYIVGSAIGIFGKDKDTKNTVNEVSQGSVADTGSAQSSDGGSAASQEAGITEAGNGAAAGNGNGNVENTGSAASGTVPDVTGKTRAEAVATLEGEGFVAEVERVNSDDVEKDLVIRQSPRAESKAERGSKVTVTVSLGKETVQISMPELKGKSEKEALALLKEQGLNGVAKEAVYSDEYPEGQVCYQSISAGITVGSDTEVEYAISKGQEPAYYSVDYTVQAPSDYAGGDAQIQLIGSDGTPIYGPTLTSSFPVNINVSGIYMVPSGQLIITYIVNKEETVTDANGVVSVQTVQVSKNSDPVEIQFTRVQ